MIAGRVRPTAITTPSNPKVATPLAEQLRASC
jgi:hypothetical protein